MKSPRWFFPFAALVGLAGGSLQAGDPVPAAPTATQSEDSIRAAAERIDELVAKSCEAQGVAMNAPINDETFVRRAYLDLIGRVPTVAEAREFLGSTYAEKRQRLIEELLASEGSVSHSYNYWADVLRVNESLGNNGKANEAAYRLWIKDALRQNKPYDQMVYELVSARGNLWDNGAIGYYQRDRGMPLDNMANTVRIFLGTRLECAQCHNHPFDKWKQMDFFQMAAFSNGMDANRYESPNRKALTQSVKEDSGKARLQKMTALREELEAKLGNDKNAIRTAMKEELAKQKKEGEGDAKPNKKEGDNSMKLVLNELYKPLRYTTVSETEKGLKLPHDYQYSDAKPEDPVNAKTMFGEPADLASGQSKIEAYAKWMASAENPTFTKVIVNRLWKRMFGLALVEPFDELTEQTQVANPELLAYLEGLMKELKFDMRGFTRILANTQTYQRAATTTELELGMPYYFQGPVLRRLTAEQVWDSVLALLVEDPDRYKPSVKDDIARIEEQKQMYESLEGRPFEEYKQMVEQLAAQTGSQAKLVEQKRKEALAARDAGDDEKAREISRELRTTQGSIEKKMRQTAFTELKRGADEAELLKVFGLTEAVLSDSVLSAAKLEAPKEALPEGMTKKERRALLQSKGEEKAKKSAKGGKANKGEAKPGELGTLARASEITARPGSFLRTFGQSDREVIENANDEATVPQALELLNGPIASALTNPGAVLAKTLQASLTPEAKIEAIYTAMLARKPSPAETSRLLEEVKTHGDQAYQDIAWAVLNGSQFLFVQ